jgi:hypothetical protein
VRSYYQATISAFLIADVNSIIGQLTVASGHDVQQLQLSAWKDQIEILKSQLKKFEGSIFFEFVIPRMGKRVDVVIILDNVVVLLEFKSGETNYKVKDIDQVWDYALDLKCFHSTSHRARLVPVLVATNAKYQSIEIIQSCQGDGVCEPVLINSDQIQNLLELSESIDQRDSHFQIQDWEKGTYLPTPTIVEAALALYSGHNVEEILRRDAEAENLASTVSTIQELIVSARTSKNKKLICFVTGVPGAGKTLVGLDIATKNIDKDSELFSVYLSGNGPLVKVLQEALTLDKVSRTKESGKKITKKDAAKEVKLFIQNIHHFRDECIEDSDNPPPEHVVIFDESQRAWNLAMTADFMQRKKGIEGFSQSEPEYLISCMDRHKDWAVIICLVGGGQEINRGEAGISEWIAAVERSFPKWNIYCSPELTKNGYISEPELCELEGKVHLRKHEHLHLATSMRSFRATRLSDMVNSIMALEFDRARLLCEEIKENYPLMLTREVEKARDWLRIQARGSQRCGLVASSKAYRLRPHAIDVRIPADPVHWFLGPKSDVRSSFYLEDIATEFQIQGLELDWVGVTWDADLRFNAGVWNHHQFVGNKWTQIKKPINQKYLENAYRVLLTRARQGMILVVPEGSDIDPTRNRMHLDPTYKLFKFLGFQEL